MIKFVKRSVAKPKNLSFVIAAIRKFKGNDIAYEVKRLLYVEKGSVPFSAVHTSSAFLDPKFNYYYVERGFYEVSLCEGKYVLENKEPNVITHWCYEEEMANFFMEKYKQKVVKLVEKVEV